MRMLTLVLCLVATSAAATSTTEDQLKNDELVLSMIEKGEGVAKEFTPGCVSPPFSTSPTNVAASGNYRFANQGVAKITAWRVPCSGNNAQLLITAAPVSGDPFVCSSSIRVVQNGAQISSLLLRQSPDVLDSVCTNLLVPVTAYLDPVSAVELDDDAAMTIVFDGNSGGQDLTLQVPAYVPGGSPGNFVIDQRVEGIWFTPGIEGQGLILDVDTVSKLFVFGWYTAKENNTGLDWMTGVGTYSGGTGTASLKRNSGVRFAEASAVQINPAGNASIKFDSCKKATLSYSLSSGKKGNLPLARLTPPPAGC